MREPLEAYLELFETYRDAFDNLLETTVDLSLLSENAVGVLTDGQLLEALRYLAGPPISEDDLKTLAEAPSLTRKAIMADPELAERIIATVREGIDRRRFPWIGDNREPTEWERATAVLASAALLASQRAATTRRNESKTAQESSVSDQLLSVGFKRVIARTVTDLRAAPKAGEFCGEAMLGIRRADLVVGLWDGRIMPIECKVSNSAVNSVKRLNDTTVAKGSHWRETFGDANTVPVAVLSGVFSLLNLVQAQDAGLTLFWAHDLVAMTDWIKQTKPASRK